MRALFNMLSALTNLYMLAISVRIILTWFSGNSYGRPVEILSRITDPYLNWFRRFPVFRVGFLDLSPIVAIAVLSVLNNVLQNLAHYGAIRLGIILAMIVSSLWSAVSFIIGFFIVVLGLRLFAFLTNRNIYGTFWRIIDTISRPILYRINRILFHGRIVHYRTGIISAIAVLAVLMAGLGFLIKYVAVPILVKLPM
jgi:YggT family protein